MALHFATTFTGSFLGLAGIMFLCGPYYADSFPAQAATTKARNPAEKSPDADLREAAERAVSRNKTQAAAAIAVLRSAGQDGVDMFIEVHDDDLPKREVTLYDRAIYRSAPGDAKTTASGDPTRAELAMDKICAQKDCAYSRLFWHTDFDTAKRAAAASGKPILSLRLLGRLDEEFSCANSRFFRTTLYPNKEVSDYLRDNYVLHWKSVRPAPRVTVDFGDGRKLERTITGNSIHYVLDTQGRPVDALPGLVGAKKFLRQLQRSNELARQTMLAANERARRKLIKTFHETALATTRTELAKDLKTVRIEVPANASLDTLQGHLTERVIELVAATRDTGGGIDGSVSALVRRKHPTASDAMPIAVTKAVVESPLQRVFFKLSRDIGRDEVQNQYQIQPKLHAMFVHNRVGDDVDHFNKQVYAGVFLTPDDDPWLGLASDDTFSALTGDGRIQ